MYAQYGIFTCKQIYQEHVHYLGFVLIASSTTMAGGGGGGGAGGDVTELTISVGATGSPTSWATRDKYDSSTTPTAGKITYISKTEPP